MPGRSCSSRPPVAPPSSRRRRTSLVRLYLPSVRTRSASSTTIRTSRTPSTGVWPRLSPTPPVGVSSGGWRDGGRGHEPFALYALAGGVACFLILCPGVERPSVVCDLGPALGVGHGAKLPGHTLVTQRRGHACRQLQRRPVLGTGSGAGDRPDLVSGQVIQREPPRVGQDRL